MRAFAPKSAPPDADQFCDARTSTARETAASRVFCCERFCLAPPLWRPASGPASSLVHQSFQLVQCQPDLPPRASSASPNLAPANSSAAATPRMAKRSQKLRAHGFNQRPRFEQVVGYLERNEPLLDQPDRKATSFVTSQQHTPLQAIPEEGFRTPAEATDEDVRLARRYQGLPSCICNSRRLSSCLAAPMGATSCPGLASKWILEPASLSQKVTNAPMSFVKARATVTLCSATHKLGSLLVCSRMGTQAQVYWQWLRHTQLKAQRQGKPLLLINIDETPQASHRSREERIWRSNCSFNKREARNGFAFGNCLQPAVSAASHALLFALQHSSFSGASSQSPGVARQLCGVATQVVVE